MKKSLMNIAFATAIVVGGILNLSAQEKKTPPPSGKAPQKAALLANMGKVPFQAQNLMKFMGRWVGDITEVSEGKTRHLDYHLIGRGTAGGSGIYLDESYSDSASGDMKGGNLAGYDPYDEKIHWYSVDNKGTTHEHTGTWKTPDSLYLEHSSIRKGKSYKEKITISFKGRDEMQFSMVAILDGKEFEKVSGVFTREKPPVRPNAPVSPAKEVKKE